MITRILYYQAGKHQKRVGKRGTSWYAVVDVGEDPATGKRRQKRISAPTRRECEQRGADLLAAARLGPIAIVSKTTVREFVDRWLQANVANVKPATIRRYVTSCTCTCSP